MTDLRKAAEMALEVFDGPVLKDATTHAMRLRKACDLLRQALEQPDEVLVEREACAKVADQWDTAITDKVAEAIRARGENPPVKTYCGGKPNYCTPEVTPDVDAVNISQERVDETAKREHEPVAYTGNGTASREADVRPTGFFFQMPKPVGEVYGWHGTGKGQPMCRFDSTEASMPVGTKLYTTPPKREWVGLTDEQRHEFVRNYGGDVISKLALVKAIEAKLKEKNT